jgi:MoaA/NifB/PqqE/SkfB family radical SAM enzyme
VNELDAIAERVARREAGAPVGPWTLEVYPTLRCNLDCAFCDTTDRHRPAVGELGPDAWLRVVDGAAALGARRIYVLGGGEPLVAAATPGILRRAKAHGMAGMLTTNGTRLGDDVAALLVEVGWDEVQVSVDGATAETHDALRGRAGAFRRTVAATCRLRRRRDSAGGSAPRIVLHTVITARNVLELPGVVRLAAALGADAVEFDSLVAYRPEQRALALDARGEALLRDAAAAGVSEGARLGVRTTLERFIEPARGRRGEAPPPAPARTGVLGRAPCLKAWHHLVVDSAGRIAACCVLAGQGEALALDNEDPVRAAWEGSAWLGALRAAMRAGAPPSRCAECSPNLLAHEAAIGARLERIGGAT